MNQSTTAETILVVDDNRALCELMEVILCSAGYHVLTAGNGSEALRLARNTPRIDLLLSDLEMRTMRGEELATRFASLHPTSSVLFVSSTDGPRESAPRCQFRAKPFTVAELRDSVRRALRPDPTLTQTANAG
jgi:DNA-binding NtrC family response regulator